MAQWVKPPRKTPTSRVGQLVQIQAPPLLLQLPVDTSGEVAHDMIKAGVTDMSETSYQMKDNYFSFHHSASPASLLSKHMKVNK